MPKLKHLIRKPDTRPAWHEVGAGPARGRSLFVNARTRLFADMVAGDYDDFFWRYLDGRDLGGTTILDVGGHVGYHAICFAGLVGAGGHVHTFEPNSFNLERMGMLIERNGLGGRVTQHALALSDRGGAASFHFSSNIDNETSSGGFLEASHTPFGDEVYRKAGFVEQSVTTETLDTFVARACAGEIGLIKIDVEGAEGPVIAGAEETLRLHRPLILAEIHSVIAMMDVAQRLTRLGYTMRVLDDDGAIAGRCFIAAEPEHLG